MLAEDEVLRNSSATSAAAKIMVGVVATGDGNSLCTDAVVAGIDPLGADPRPVSADAIENPVVLFDNLFCSFPHEVVGGEQDADAKPEEFRADAPHPEQGPANSPSSRGTDLAEDQGEDCFAWAFSKSVFEWRESGGRSRAVGPNSSTNQQMYGMDFCSRMYPTPSSIPVSFGPGGQIVILQAPKPAGLSNQHVTLQPLGQNPDPHDPLAGHNDQNAAFPEEPRTALPRSVPSGARSAPLVDEDKSLSLEDSVEFLAKVQLIEAVPTVSQLRAARPPYRTDDEIYSVVFVLQKVGMRQFSEWIGSQRGMRTYHPFLQGGKDGSFGQLEDGAPVVWQTNGIARIHEPIMHKIIRCDRTGAPGTYSESRVLVARLRAPGNSDRGLVAAKRITTRQALVENLFYSFTSVQMFLACIAPTGELSKVDGGERIMCRRAIKDFRQHYFHDFPAAKHLVQLFDEENEVMIREFSYSQRSAETACVPYRNYALFSWETYEQDRRPPKKDMAVQLVDAARDGDAAEVRKLMADSACDGDAILTEFGVIGSIASAGFYTRSSQAYGQEHTALIAAVQSGHLSVVEVILSFVCEGRATLNVVCCEWSPEGRGGECLRESYTALDMSRIYHRKGIEKLLWESGAKSHRDCKGLDRENPFDIRRRQDQGDHDNSGWKRTDNESRYAGLLFVEFMEREMDDEMAKIVKGLKAELTKIKELNFDDQESAYRKLAFRWHPDKHPDKSKELATSVFQWIQNARFDKILCRAPG